MPSLCPRCAEPVEPGTRFCPRDGEPILDGDSAGTDAIGDVSAPAAVAVDVAVDVGDGALGRIIDGRYRVVRKLGSGGVGSVYQAEHVAMKKRVALKLLHAVFAHTDEDRRRFEREAQAASRLSHPACVSVTDFGEVHTLEPEGDPELLGAPYLVMEYVPGRTLDDVLAERRPSPSEAVVIARAALSALRHAHELGIIHRDIKPPNIMLVADAGTGTPVKLLDFGLARTVDPAPDGARVTQIGIVCGTPGYVSPEQATGGVLDARTDLYSLGVVLFEMLCGRPPFEREDAVGLMLAHVTQPAPSVRELSPELSPELAAVVARALEKDAAARFESAAAFQQALADTPEGGARRAQRRATGWRPSRSQLIWGGLTVGAAALAMGGWALLSGGAPASAPPLRPLPIAALPVAALTLSPAAQRARALVDGDRSDDAILAARAALASSSRDTGARLVLAIAYQRKLWCSDALEELEHVLRDAPSLAGGPEVTRTAIACLRARTQGKAVRFLVEHVGPSCAPALRVAAAASEPDADIRHGAERALEQLEPHAAPITPTEK